MKIKGTEKLRWIERREERRIDAPLQLSDSQTIEDAILSSFP